MRGILCHLLITLRLNFRARQALVYGYLVPIFFLLAFGSVFRSSVPPLLHEMGQLITITILGGACFGMPTAMVAERERGVWRRYRLLPASTAAFVVSAMAARWLIILLAVLMQAGLAWCIYRTPLPAHPLDAIAAFSIACFAFLGMGLVIAMLAGAVPAVQALGQAIFLPMIMIGGVGVPLRALPAWAQHVAGFLPGRYAVEALDACWLPGGPGLAGARFALAALLVIGAAGCAAGAGLFRWDSTHKTALSPWLLLPLAAWAGVGLAAERLGPAAHPMLAGSAARWQAVSDAEIAAIRFDHLPPDDGLVAPIASSLADVSPAARARIDTLRSRLEQWPPAHRGDLDERVRNLLSAAAIFDILEDPDEGAIGLAVTDFIRSQYPAGDLKRILAWILDHPAGGTVLTSAPELGAEGQITEAAARERMLLYARKLLLRVEQAPRGR